MDDRIDLKPANDEEKKLKKLKTQMIVLSVASFVFGCALGKATGYVDGSRDTIGFFLGIHK